MSENKQSAGRKRRKDNKPSAIPLKHLKTGPWEAACWPVWERICASMSWENENCRLVDLQKGLRIWFFVGEVS